MEFPGKPLMEMMLWSSMRPRGRRLNGPDPGRDRLCWSWKPTGLPAIPAAIRDIIGPKRKLRNGRNGIPSSVLRRNTLPQGFSPTAIADDRASVDRELDEAVTFAESSPSPHAEECLTDVYVE